MVIAGSLVVMLFYYSGLIVGSFFIFDCITV